MAKKKIKKQRSNNIPKEYTKDLPRVSSIVEFVYPFWWKDKELFLDWLWKKNVDYIEYMEEASYWGRFVHSQLENRIINWINYSWKEYRGYVDNWLSIINSWEFEFIESEKYVRWADYQGTIDCVVKRVSDWKYWILDWKTYWLAKDKFWISSTYRKPYDKLKKASLQLSLYKNIIQEYNIEFLIIAELWNNYHNLYYVDIWDKEEIDRVVKEYKLTNIDI